MRSRSGQLEFGFTNLGGRRRGAGRKASGPRSRVPHARRERLRPTIPVHVTMRLAAGLPSLRGRRDHRIVLASLAAACKPGFRVVHYSAQSNHLHFVCEADHEVALSRGVQGLGVRLARGLNRLWRRVGRVFDDRYHAHLLRTPREVRNALAYVLQNARRHGLSCLGRLDPCSSARWFDGWRDLGHRLMSIRHPLRDARTWLLTTGWRRLGLLASDPRFPRNSAESPS